MKIFSNYIRFKNLFIIMLCFLSGWAGASELKSPSIHKNLDKLASQSVLVPIKGGGFAVLSSSGYICSTENNMCICEGGANSEDCIAMRDNICREGEDLNCDYPSDVCTCSWGSGLSGSGGVSNPMQTQSSH